MNWDHYSDLPSPKAYQMTKLELDELLDSLLGPRHREHWWNSPNKHWNYQTPLTVYESSESGKKEVEEYILGYCFGK